MNLINEDNESYTDLNVVLGMNDGVDAATNVFTGSNVDGNVVEQSIEQVGWTKVSRIDEIVGALRVFLQPETLVGRVVQHNIADAQDLPAIN